MARHGIMLCYPFEEKRLREWSTPWLAQPKLDGERCRALITDGRVMLVSSEENVFFSVPHINQQLARMFAGKTIELDGELYKHNMTFQQIHSIVSRTTNLHPQHELIEYHIFDVVMPGPQLIRTNELLLLSEGHDMGWVQASTSQPNIKIVPSLAVSSLPELLEVQEKVYGALHYEGFILRHEQGEYVRKRSTHVMKFKPRKTDSYLIVGYQEEMSKDGVPKGSMGALVCEKDGQQFNVAASVERTQRDHLWVIRDELVGRYARIHYQQLTERGVPRFGVLITIEEEGDE